MSSPAAAPLLTPCAVPLARSTDLGPRLHKGGVFYRVWAQGRETVVAEVEKPGLPPHRVALQPEGDTGYFSANDPAGGAGDLYRFSLDGRPAVPDFASRRQPRGVHGPSQVVDPGAYRWQARDWKRPGWEGQVLYECHLGTFTPEGTFRAAIGRLPHLAALGATALEIMPVAEFHGARNWGYDGVFPFAPSQAYGTPDDFRALIDACHGQGLAVVLDVVFNHLGPEGNYSHAYSPFYFHQGKDNPWGRNFNLHGPQSAPVRALLLQNIRSWLEEFRLDGFRMDATHAIHDESPVHILAEIAALVHRHGGFIVAEDERNAREVLDPPARKGWGFDAAWADDFHHAVRVSQTGERNFYFASFSGTAAEIAETVRKGWHFCGQESAFHGRPRGTSCADFPPDAFVYAISNHDQTGNRPGGERLHQVIEPAAYRAASLFLCLVPETPLLFMGQEWAAGSPFLYFTDMPEELGRLIGEGRKKELGAFAPDPAALAAMPAPQDPETFRRSKLRWEELDEAPHRRVLELYRAGLRLRRELFGGKNPPRSAWHVSAAGNTVIVHYRFEKRRIDLFFHLAAGEGKAGRNAGAGILLRSNDPLFGEAAPDAPETVVVEL